MDKDSVTFNSFITEIRPKLIKHAERKLVAEPHFLAEEMVEEIIFNTFCKINSHEFKVTYDPFDLSSFDSTTQKRLCSYLWTCLKNAIAYYFRKIKKISSIITDIEERRYHTTINPYSLLIAQEKKEIINKTLDLLSEEHKIILTMRHLRDSSLGDISDILNIDRSLTSSKLSHASKKFAKIFIQINNFYSLTNDLLTKILNCLSEKYKKPLTMYLLHNLSLDQIPTTQSRLNKALEEFDKNFRQIQSV